MSALCSKEYLMWDIIHLCIEISSAVWKLASGEFYFKKKKNASENRKNQKASTTDLRESPPAAGGFIIFRKLSYIPDERRLFTVQKITFKLGKIRVLAPLSMLRIFFLP